MSKVTQTTSGSGPLNLKRVRREQISEVVVSGELDVQTGTALRTALGEELNHHDITCVIVDLTAVSFMSSTGIAVLIDAANEAHREQRQLRVIVGDVYAVRHPLEITGVDQTLDLYLDPTTPLTT